MATTTDREMMERVAAKEAGDRDRALTQIEHQYASRVACAKARYEAALSEAVEFRASARNRAFRKMEVAQEATENFIRAKNDSARIKPFGLTLPLLHPSNDLLRSAQSSLRQSA